VANPRKKERSVAPFRNLTKNRGPHPILFLSPSSLPLFPTLHNFTYRTILNEPLFLLVSLSSPEHFTSTLSKILSPSEPPLSALSLHWDRDYRSTSSQSIAPPSYSYNLPGSFRGCNNSPDQKWRCWLFSLSLLSLLKQLSPLSPTPSPQV